MVDKEIRDLKKEGQKLKLDLQQQMNTSRITLMEFRCKYTKKGDLVYSPAFYTHPHGYRMCVRVAVDGNGAHLSIYIHMMRGPFDNHLKWPFRGFITIHLVNQAGDNDHVENIIPYNDTTPDSCAGRVTSSDNERAHIGRGFRQFLAHADLGYNAAKKTQYLKDDHLIIRVLKVTIR